MNVFEDLIEELKEEHLLEQTVVEKPAPKAEPTAEIHKSNGPESSESVRSEAADLTNDEILENEEFLRRLEAEEIGKSGSQPEIKAETLSDQQFIADEAEPPAPPQNVRQPLSEIEYFRKRAMEEVSSLQMVDHIFSCVEREQMKIMPKPYDDFKVKMVLHSFMQVSGEINSPQHAEAEFQLMLETESWYSVLAERDQKISVENLRYCCENTRPPLSPPALLALARFYRNSPFTEPVRNKFDLIITRLFSRDIEFEKREFVFTREELIGHLTELYLEWESIPPEIEENQEDLLQLVQTFEDFITQGREAASFGDLIESEFFKQFRLFKKSIGERFYAPIVAAAAIECNISVGNRYLELLEKEQQNSDNAELEAKYGFLNDQLISNATSKTLQMVDLLEELRNKPKPAAPHFYPPENTSRRQTQKKKAVAKKTGSKFARLAGVNKFLLAATVLTIILTAGLYFWVEMAQSPLKKSPEVIQLDLKNMDFKDYTVSARISNEALFAISSPVWDAAPREKKEEVLKKMMSAGKNNGFNKVHIFDNQGNVIGAANDKRVEIK